ncbi:hypothetical protein GCM10017744_019600 [Streptomyces antimycoticus]
MLTTDPDITVVAEADDGHQAVELVHRHRPRVAVLDIRMPGTGGIEAAREIHRTAPATGVIMLTTFGEDDYILQALSGGATGFLIKSGEPEELIAGVRAVAMAPPICHRRSRPASWRISPPVARGPGRPPHRRPRAGRRPDRPGA